MIAIGYRSDDRYTSSKQNNENPKNIKPNKKDAPIEHNTSTHSMWHHCGIMLASSWNHVGTMLESSWDHVWDHFRIMVGSLWNHCGVTSASFWDHCGVIMKSCWGHFGIILGSIWDHYGVTVGSPPDTRVRPSSSCLLSVAISAQGRFAHRGHSRISQLWPMKTIISKGIVFLTTSRQSMHHTFRGAL